jgi:hypothetical protein
MLFVKLRRDKNLLTVGETKRNLRRYTQGLFKTRRDGVINTKCRPCGTFNYC